MMPEVTIVAVAVVQRHGTNLECHYGAAVVRFDFDAKPDCVDIDDDDDERESNTGRRGDNSIDVAVSSKSTGSSVTRDTHR